MDEKSKYESQMRNLRKNYVRFPLDLKPDVLEAFKTACTANGTTPTTEIKKFIDKYIATDPAYVEVEADLPAWLNDAAEQAGIDCSKLLSDELQKLLDVHEDNS